MLSSMNLRLIAASLMLAACAPPEAPPPDAGAVVEPPDAGLADAGQPDAGTAFVLTSPALAQGAAFPVRYTCNDAMTAGRVSLPLSWTASDGARSYAVVMTDTSINLIHWVIWDIPGAVLELTEGIANVATPQSPPGAKQTHSYDGVTFGYRGPCPPAQHVYRFEVSALDVDALPAVTPASTRDQVDTAIAAHRLTSATLSGVYGP
jgi:Raf kinase inhibitor-like YbhB/YbcL family protein